MKMIDPRRCLPLFGHALRASVCSGLLGCGPLSWAQMPADEPQRLPEVRVRAAAAGPAAQASHEPLDTLRGSALRGKVAATLGATLQDELGVANASFGPGVGLPIIRGQGGARVSTMVGGMGTHDASTVSADHGVMVEPALAEKITVWRGPAAIRFGGGALGGAVDIDDGRLPEQRRARLTTRGEARVGARSGLAVLRLDGPAGPAMGWHVDVHQRRQGLVRVPGLAIDEEAVRRQFQLVNTVNTRGHIGNSDARTEGGAVSGTWWGEHSQVGLALSTLQQHYGIPTGAHSHQDGTGGGGDERIRIDARQQRLDLKGAWHEPWRLSGQLRWRMTHTDYGHDETAQGVTQTTFSNRVTEARVELEHQVKPGWRSTVGAQAQDRTFSAKGLEAFVPRTALRTAGAFTVQQFDRGPWRLEAGARAEVHSSRPLELQPAGDQTLWDQPARRFEAGSLSLALTRRWTGGQATLTHWQVARAPEVQELYALGPHLATLTYDNGNGTLRTETLQGWDLGWTQALGPTTLKANAYRYASPHYIYQRSTGSFYDAEEEVPRAACARLDQCLPITKYEQAAARLHGYELAWSLPFGTPGGDDDTAPYRVGVFADMVRGRLLSGSDLPRLPPRRWGLRFDLARGPWWSEWRLVRSEAQRRPGESETPTASHVQLHGSLRWSTRLASGQRLSWFVHGRNLTNAEARSSTSFLRNYAPEPGRTLEVGLETRL